MNRLLLACTAAAMAVVTSVSAGAQGVPKAQQRNTLSRVELLALQQQLRDDGCGVAHVTGVLDAPTRSAIARCKNRYQVTGGARDLLAAMNIGFPLDTQQTGMGGMLPPAIKSDSATNIPPTPQP